MFALQPPPPLKPLLNDLFIAPPGGLVKELPFEFLGQIFLSNKAIFVVVGVFVIFPVADILHQARGRVADVKRHRQRAGFLDRLLHLTIGGINAVALGARRQINGCLGQRQSAFRVPQKFKGFHGAQGNAQRLGICIADIFGRKANHAASNVKRVFTGRQHPLKPVKRGIRVTAPQAFSILGLSKV